MKGLEISHNMDKTEACVKEGTITVLISYYEDQAHLSITGIDYNQQQMYSWRDAMVNQDDKIEVSFKEIEQISIPNKIRDDRFIKAPKSKLELYKELENSLKERKLI